MANFAELSCFNKLLLDKMKRMEQKHKEEIKKLENKYEKLENTYNSLMEETIECGENESVQYCDGCDLWFDIVHTDGWRDDDGYYCGMCVEKGLCPYEKCCDCDDFLNLNFLNLTCDEGFVCKRCFKFRQYNDYYSETIEDYNNIKNVFEKYNGNKRLYMIELLNPKCFKS